MFKNRKGQNIAGLKPFILVIAAVAVLGGILTLVITSVNIQAQRSITVAVNHTDVVGSTLGNGSAGILNVTSNLPLVATIGALAVVAALAIGIFAARRFG